jgi:endogenous inhibitor of DNA gyrase (YacG/DUF329 family)
MAPTRNTTRQKTCPVCHKPVVAKFAPFCSARCANIDLGRWFGETYRVPAAPPEHSDDEIGEDEDFEG